MLLPLFLTVGAVTLSYFFRMDVFCSAWYAPAVEVVLIAPVESSEPIIDSAHVSMGKDVEAESILKMKIYTGLEPDSSDESSVQLNWQPCSSRENVNVEASAVAGSFWQAVRAVTEIKGNKRDILKLIIDDSRIGEFDDMFDFSQVMVRLNVPNILMLIKLC